MLLACGTSVFAPISVAQTSVSPSPAAQTSLTPTSAPSQQAPDRIAILDTPPWYFQQDNAPQGLLVDLTALLFAESAPTLQPLPPRRLAAELASGAFHWAYWPCHVAAGAFSNLGVVATTQYGIAVRADSPYQQLQDLRQHTVGVWAERLGMLPELETDPAITKHEVNSLGTALQMLINKRLDGVCLAEGVLNWHVRRGRLADSTFRFLPLRQTQMCLFASEQASSERQQHLRNTLADAAMREQIASLVGNYW